ncbi:MAG: hypothetical protein ACXABF_09375 [Candidatus Thorarchaeota archaeon]
MKEEGFVCPVLGGKAGENGEHKGLTYIDNSGEPVEDFWSNIRGASGKGPHTINVPEHATNQNGAGGPHGPTYASPGEEDYSPIWNTE